MATSIKIESGKYYKTRDGLKVRVYCVDGASPYPVHGAMLIEGEWTVETWTINGMIAESEIADGADIVEEWVDPQVNWEYLPKWANWFAINSNGHGLWFTKKPIIVIESNLERWDPWDSWGKSGYVPDEYIISRKPWKESLEKRPQH